MLTAYDAETRVEVGPPGPDSVAETIERFQKLLSAFSDAPWTFQRLSEILLEPKRQYSRLPKVRVHPALAAPVWWGASQGSPPTHGRTQLCARGRHSKPRTNHFCRVGAGAHGLVQAGGCSGMEGPGLSAARACAHMTRTDSMKATFALLTGLYVRYCIASLNFAPPDRTPPASAQLALAIEKCLLVTTELPPTATDQLPPPPLLTELGPVNANPAPVYTNSHHHGGGSHGGGHGGGGAGGGGDDSGSAFTQSMLDLRHHPGHHHHLGNHTGRGAAGHWRAAGGAMVWRLQA